MRLPLKDVGESARLGSAGCSLPATLSASNGAMSDQQSTVQAPDEADQVRIVLRPYASTIPLASFAFGVGNVLYAAFLLHWIPQSESMLLAVMLLAFAAPLELFPCAMAFVSRDGGGATAFGIFGASWIVLGVQLIQTGGAQKPSVTGGNLFAADGALPVDSGGDYLSGQAAAGLCC